MYKIMHRKKQFTIYVKINYSIIKRRNRSVTAPPSSIGHDSTNSTEQGRKLVGKCDVKGGSTLYIMAYRNATIGG